MYRTAVLGDYDSIYGFASVGLEIFPVDGAGEAKTLIRRLADSDYAVIYITEALAAKIPEEIERCQERFLPAVIRIPGVSGNTGEGVQGVRQSVEQAVGADLLFGGAG